MVPAPAPATPRSSRTDPRWRRAGAGNVLRFESWADGGGRPRCILGGLLLAGLLVTNPAAAQTSDDVETGITWTRAFLTGAAERATADTRPLVGSQLRSELYLVLEGEKAGLPIYCTEQADFRIDGRAIPARMVISPGRAGLKGAEIHWASLHPERGGVAWSRRMIPSGDNRWSLEVTRFEGPSAPGVLQTCGTARYAAAVLPPGRTQPVETDGWSKRPDWGDPERAPGLVVSRARSTSLSGQALGFARLPVDGRATLAHARNRVALRAIDLVPSAYEDLAGVRLDESRSAPLDGEEWSWLFEVIVETAVRRPDDESARAIGENGRGVPWSGRGAPDPSNLQRDDVLLLEDTVVILISDDGDGWLGNRDLVLHTLSGEVSEGPLGELPGRTLRVVRLRSFQALRLDLTEAGYGDLGRSAAFGAELRRAVREFEGDHGLPVDGRPDSRLFEELATFLARLRAPAESSAGDGP